MDEIKKALSKEVKNRTALTFLYKEWVEKRAEEDEFSESLELLHNEGAIDLITEFKAIDKDDPDYDFFMLQDLFCKILPSLNSPIDEVCACVKHIIKEAGNDLAATRIIEPFADYCRAHISDIPRIIELELGNFDPHAELLSTVLRVGAEVEFNKYVDSVLSLLNNKQAEIVRAAIFTIGKINFENQPKSLERCFKEVSNIASGNSNDNLFYNTLTALFNLYSQKQSLCNVLVEFINDNKDENHVQFTHEAISILLRERIQLPVELETALLDTAIAVLPSSGGSINLFDTYLSEKVRNGHLQLVIDTLESVLIGSDFEITISEFSTTARELRGADINKLSETVTQWLLKRETGFALAAKDLIKTEKEGGIELWFHNSTLMREKDSPHEYLARKTCGWFFNRPITAASLILSLSDSCPVKVRNEISDILFNPILISFSGSVKSYLESQEKTAPSSVKKICSNLLKKLDAYHKGLKAAFELKELKPSEEQLFTRNRKQQNEMNEVMQEARRKSFFAGMFSESVVLYGNKSIQYIYHGEQSSRQVVPFHTHSVSTEFPSMANLDPHSLEEKLH